MGVASFVPGSSILCVDMGIEGIESFQGVAPSIKKLAEFFGKKWGNGQKPQKHKFLDLR